MGIDPSIIDLHYRFAHHWVLAPAFAGPLPLAEAGVGERR
jgi:hypothetical protein